LHGTRDTGLCAADTIRIVATAEMVSKIGTKFDTTSWSLSHRHDRSCGAVVAPSMAFWVQGVVFRGGIA